MKCIVNIIVETEEVRMEFVCAKNKLTRSLEEAKQSRSNLRNNILFESELATANTMKITQILKQLKIVNDGISECDRGLEALDKKIDKQRKKNKK